VTEDDVLLDGSREDPGLLAEVGDGTSDGDGTGASSHFSESGGEEGGLMGSDAKSKGGVVN
jgi:hypothetical protein